VRIEGGWGREKGGGGERERVGDNVGDKDVAKKGN
jgi:hypothetical protein